MSEYRLRHADKLAAHYCCSPGGACRSGVHAAGQCGTPMYFDASCGAFSLAFQASSTVDACILMLRKCICGAIASAYRCQLHAFVIPLGCRLPAGRADASGGQKTRTSSCMAASSSSSRRSSAACAASSGLATDTLNSASCIRGPRGLSPQSWSAAPRAASAQVQRAAKTRRLIQRLTSLHEWRLLRCGLGLL